MRVRSVYLKIPFPPMLSENPMFFDILKENIMISRKIVIIS